MQRLVKRYSSAQNVPVSQLIDSFAFAGIVKINPFPPPRYNHLQNVTLSLLGCVFG